MAELVSLTQNLAMAMRLEMSRVFLFQRQFANFEAVLDAVVPLLQSGDMAQEPFKLHRLQIELSSLFSIVASFLTPPGHAGSLPCDLLKAAALSHCEALRKQVNGSIESIVSALLAFNLQNPQLDAAIRQMYDPTTRSADVEREAGQAADEFKAVLATLKDSEDSFTVASRKLGAVGAAFEELMATSPQAAFFSFYVTSFTDTLLYEVLHTTAEMDAEESEVKFRPAAVQLEECFGSMGTIRKKRCRVTKVDEGVRTKSLADIIQRQTFTSGVEHPNIAPYIGSFLKENVVYVVEGVIGPSLHQVLHNKNPRAPAKSLSSSQCFAVFFGVLNGLRYLHKHNFAFHGVCPRNILLGRQSHQGAVKLVGNIRKNHHIDECGELLPYLPPEVLFDEEWSFAADMYGFGVSMWESVHLDKFPFGRESNIHQCVYAHERPEFDELSPGWVKECAVRCWNTLPAVRPTADHLYADFNGHVVDHGDPSQSILSIFSRGQKPQKKKAQARTGRHSANRSSATKSRLSSGNPRMTSFTSSVFSTDKLSSLGEEEEGQTKHKKAKAQQEGNGVKPRLLGSGDMHSQGPPPMPPRPKSGNSSYTTVEEEEDTDSEGEDGSQLGWQSPLPPPRPAWKVARNGAGTRNARSIMLMLGVKNPKPPNIPIPPPPGPPRPPSLG